MVLEKIAMALSWDSSTEEMSTNSKKVGGDSGDTFTRCVKEKNNQVGDVQRSHHESRPFIPNTSQLKRIKRVRFILLTPCERILINTETHSEKRRKIDCQDTKTQAQLIRIMYSRLRLGTPDSPRL